MKYNKLKINKLPEPEILETHIKVPKASNNKYSLVKASYSGINNTITLYKYSLEESFSYDDEYDGINRWLALFFNDGQLSINHEMHHKHNYEAKIDEYGFTVLYNYKFALLDEMSAKVVNYKQLVEKSMAPQRFKDFYLLFYVSFDIIENYLHYANQFYKSAFCKENKTNILSLSDQDILYNEVLDWYFTYDFGKLLNEHNKKWLNKFIKDIFHVFAVNETIETPQDQNRITGLVKKRRNKWLEAKVVLKERLDKKINEYHQKNILKDIDQSYSDK